MKSILVALDGSKDALNASEAAWKLAKSNKAKILAMSVIDTQAIWDFLGHKLAGLIGSGCYVAAYETIYGSLRNISDALLLSFAARSEGFGIQTETVITEGKLADTVIKQAESNDMLIMGRRAKYDSTEHSLYRSSLSEKLAEVSNVPVLMVSSEPRRWTTARFVFDSKSFDRQQILQFFQLAQDLKLQPELFCTDESANESGEKIKEFCPTAAPMLSHDTAYGDESWQSAVDVTSETLLLISTSNRGGERCVGNGPAIRKFMRSLPILSFVIFPPKAEAAKGANTQALAPGMLTR